MARIIKKKKTSLLLWVDENPNQEVT